MNLRSDDPQAFEADGCFSRCLEDRAKYDEIRIRLFGVKCFFERMRRNAKHRNERGPCKHILAAQIVGDGDASVAGESA